MKADAGRNGDSALPTGNPVQTDPKQAFGALVAKVRSEVRAILKSEAATGELHCADDGIVLDSGGAWNAAIWKPYGNMLEIACRRGPGETWRVLVHPLRPSWTPRVLDWPSGALRGRTAGSGDDAPDLRERSRHRGVEPVVPTGFEPVSLP